MKKALTALLPILLLLLITACTSESSSEPEKEYGGVYGKVTKFGTDSALAGIIVTAGNLEVTTDALGNYKFDKIESAQTITMTFAKSGYQGVAQKALITANYELQVDVSMQKYYSQTVAPQEDIIVTPPQALGNPVLKIPAGVIEDENGITPDSAIVNITTAHVNHPDFIRSNSDTFTADSSGAAIRLQPLIAVNFNLESIAKGSLGFKTGKTGSITVESSKNSKGLMRLFHFENGKFVHSSDTLLTDNKSGLIKAKVSKTGRWLFARVVTDERLKTETDFVFIDGDWHEKVKYNYDYTGGDLLSNRIGLIGNQNAEKITIDYNSSNLPSKIEEFVWNGSSWINKRTIAKSYNNFNLVAEVIMTDASDSIKSVFTYSGDKLTVVEVFYKNQSIYIKCKDYRLTYINGGNKVSEVVFTDGLGADADKTKYCYEYKNGNLKKQRQYFYSNNQWTEQQYTDLEYNANGKIDYANIFQTNQGSAPSMIIGKYNFTYSDNLLTKKIYSSIYDGSLAVECENTYRYNGNRHLIFNEEIYPRSSNDNLRMTFGYESGQGNVATVFADLMKIEEIIDPLGYICPVPVKK